MNRQRYYRSAKREIEERELACQVVEMVKGVRGRMPRLGGKKLYFLLKAQLRPLGVGRDKLFDILRANRLLVRPKRQYRATTNSHHRFRKHKNLIEGLEIRRPEQVLVSDITYVGGRANPMYLSLVTDAYSKKIMGFNVSTSLDATGAAAALKMAIKNRAYRKKGLIHHSDRGVQYCCDLYQKVLQKKRIKCSMTEKYDPYQNAVAERVNGILKQEFINCAKIKNLDLMKAVVKNSVEIYNRQRPHFSNFLLTPQQMHRQSKIKMRTYKNQKTEYRNKPILS